jgi:arginyl-tRNA synthetase
VFTIIRDSIFNGLSTFSGTKDNFSKHDILISAPKIQARGDLYTNAAMSFSKALNVVPKVLAKSIADSLMQNESITEVTIASPGFVNFRVDRKFWHASIDNIISKGKDYSYTNLKNGESINVEFVSANPTGPLHTGHARNAVFGSVASNLFERIGYKVTREFYINDKGNQIDSLARSLYLRYKEALGISISEDNFDEGMYCGEYLKELAFEIMRNYLDEFLNKDESDWIEFFKDFAVKRLLKSIEADLSILGVNMDVYTSELELHKQRLVDEAVSILTEKNDMYEGILPKPKGMVIEDWEEKSQLLFKSTKYGDDIDRPVKKSDGTWTYFAGDLAYHLNKMRRGFYKMVTILGADHNGYIKRLKSAVNALGNGKQDIEIRLYQLINFLEKGKPVRMSKRSGNFITLKDVVERVGKDVTRYMMISRHHDVPIDFDLVKAVELSMDNPVFYIQYAYARICSVFRNYESNFGQINIEELKTCSKDPLTDEAEIFLIRALTFWPDQISAAAIAIEPHRVTIFLQEIASLFHSLWNKGKINTELRFISPNNKEESLARMSLLYATKLVLEDGFKIIGIEPLSEMR